MSIATKFKFALPATALMIAVSTAASAAPANAADAVSANGGHTPTIMVNAHRDALGDLITERANRKNKAR